MAAVRRDGRTAATFTPYRKLRSDRGLRRRLDAPALDACLHRGQLTLQRSRDGAREVVERREPAPAGLQRADVGAAGERAVGHAQHGGFHRRHDALLHTGDEVLAVLSGAGAAVDIHPFHGYLGAAGRAVRVLDRLGRAESDVARDGEDDVGALADEGLGQRLALGLVGEITGERALLGLLVPAEDLYVRAVLGVVGLHAVPVAVHVDGHGRQLDPAERRHLAGLGHARGQVAAEVAVLDGVVGQLVNV